MGPAKSRFNTRYDAALAAEEKKALAELDLFRGDVTAFVNAYDFLSQIVNYADTDLEKRAVFCRLLAREIADKTRHQEIDLTGVQLVKYALKEGASGTSSSPSTEARTPPSSRSAARAPAPLRTLCSSASKRSSSR